METKKVLEPSSLVDNEKEYYGMHVATSGPKSRKVIASGDKPSNMVKELRRKGIHNPVIIYIPDPAKKAYM